MDPTQILAAIQLAAKLAALALKVGADALPFIRKIQAFSAPGAAQPTEADFDELNAMGQPFLDQLNDTSRDDT